MLHATMYIADCIFRVTSYFVSIWLMSEVLVMIILHMINTNILKTKVLTITSNNVKAFHFFIKAFEYITTNLLPATREICRVVIVHIRSELLPYAHPPV